MKAIMISIKPKWVAKIMNGEKTIEIRKTMPKCDLPIDVYIYCTKDKETIAINPYGGYATIPNKYKNEYFNGKVVAKFTLNKVEEIPYFDELTFPDGYENYDGEWIDTSKEYKNVHYITIGDRKNSCLSYEELQNYLGKENGYAWHIDNLLIFDKPKELDEFRNWKRFDCYNADFDYTTTEYRQISLTKAPQNMCYVEVE